MPRIALLVSFTAAALAACSSSGPRSDAAHTAAPAPAMPPRSAVATPATPQAASPAATPVSPLLGALSRLAPDADAGVIALALEARDCAARNGHRVGDKLAVIDYSRPSTQKRLWVFDVKRTQLLYHEHVAHGRGSGENHARAFSNRDGSHQTSLGLYTTAETYEGGNGYSMRMDGLDAGVNDAARDRLIVMHGAPYVDPAQAQRQGRLGRSFGCPAVRPEIAKRMIDTLKHGQTLFAYYPDAQWLRASRNFGCNGRDARQIYARARRPDPRGGASGMQAAAAH